MKLFKTIKHNADLHKKNGNQEIDLRLSYPETILGFPLVIEEGASITIKLKQPSNIGGPLEEIEAFFSYSMLEDIVEYLEENI